MNELNLDKELFEKLKTRGVSESELENLKNALGLVEASKKLPEDIPAFLKRVDEYFPDTDLGKTVTDFLALQNSDPEFFMQIAAMQTLLGVTDSPIETTSLGDALRQINEASGEYKQELKRQLVERAKHLTPETKTEFLAEIANLSNEEKKEMLDILSNK